MGERAEIVHNMEYDQGVQHEMQSYMYLLNQIRQRAISRLSTDLILSPIEKIHLARAHGVSAWLDEAVSSLATCNPIPALNDLATLG